MHRVQGKLAVMAQANGTAAAAAGKGGGLDVHKPLALYCFEPWPAAVLVTGFIEARCSLLPPACSRSCGAPASAPLQRW